MALNDQQIQALQKYVKPVTSQIPTTKNSKIYVKETGQNYKVINAPQATLTARMSPRP